MRLLQFTQIYVEFPNMHAPKTSRKKPYICHGTGGCTLLQQDGTRVYHTCTPNKFQPEMKAEKFHSPKNRMRKVEELKIEASLLLFFGSIFCRFFVVIPESSNGSFMNQSSKQKSTEP